MKKKLLVVFMAAAMSMALIACGGSEEEGTSQETEVTEETEAAEEVSGDYTEEQLAFLEEYSNMVDEYNAAIDVFNATPELVENQQLVDTMNTLTESINEVDEICADPSLLTAENMELLRTTAFAETYKLIEQINAYVEGGDVSAEMTDKEILASLFTTAFCGADTEENTYYFLCNDDISVAGFVMVSADITQSANVVGNVTDHGDGTLTITGEDGEYIKFAVEEAEDGLILTFEDGSQAAMLPWDINEVIDIVIAIDEETEIIG